MQGTNDVFITPWYLASTQYCLIQKQGKRALFEDLLNIWWCQPVTWLCRYGYIQEVLSGDCCYQPIIWHQGDPPLFLAMPGFWKVKVFQFRKVNNPSKTRYSHKIDAVLELHNNGHPWTAHPQPIERMQHADKKKEEKKGNCKKENAELPRGGERRLKEKKGSRADQTFVEKPNRKLQNWSVPCFFFVRYLKSCPPNIMKGIQRQERGQLLDG